jgi:UDP-glucose 4-epimerase
MKSVAITGISGYIGSQLLTRLAQMEAVDKIVGVDIKPPPIDPVKLKFYQQDISKPLGAIFAENEVDTAIHLAFILRPNRHRIRTQQIDIGGSQNFLKACHEANVRHIVYLSSHTVYGAHLDNPSPLKEDSPLRPLFGFQYSWDKAETEKVWREFAETHHEASVTILRSCPVVGPNAADSITALMFKPPVIIGVSGYDPPMQFVHEDDLIELITTLINRPVPGIYNVANDGEIKYSEIAELAMKRMVCLPEKLIHPILGLSWKLHLQNASQAIGLEFIKYPPVVSTEALKTKMNFRFHYSSREAVAAFLLPKPLP